MREKILNKWKMSGILPFQSDFSKTVQQGLLLHNLTPWISAKVPGSVYRDLMEANIIDDPYYGENSLNCEWVANRWWVYRTVFTLTKEDFKEHLFVTFYGIDYSAKIYLNGKLLGKHEGMFIPFE